MTLQEVYQKSKDGHREAVRTALRKGVEVSDLDCENVTELYIFHDYEGLVPDLSLFPQLVAFSSSVALTPDYLERQNLSDITHLSLTFDNGSGHIKINAPNLTDLDIYIRNNEDDQLSLFQNNDNAIDISVSLKLKSFKISHTTGYEIITGGIINCVEKVVIIDRRTCDFQFLYNFPCVRELTIGSSKCNDVSFAQRLTFLEYVDFSYNEIEDVTCLAHLPLLKKVDIYRNNVREVSCLASKRCEIIWTEEDHSFASFKRSVATDIALGYSYVQHCRKPNPRRAKFWDDVYVKKTDEEIFCRYLRAKLKEEIENYTVNAKKHYRIPVPIERISSFINVEFPFLDYQLDNA